MTFDPEPFRSITLQDMTMPGGWSVSRGQTYLYTPAEQRIMHEARAFAQQEILPKSAEAHRRVKDQGEARTGSRAPRAATRDREGVPEAAR